MTIQPQTQSRDLGPLFTPNAKAPNKVPVERKAMAADPEPVPDEEKTPMPAPAPEAPAEEAPPAEEKAPDPA